MDEFLTDWKKLKKYTKVTLFVLFNALSSYVTYQYAFKRGEAFALQAILDTMNNASSEKPDGEPGNLQHPVPENHTKA